MRTAIFVAVVLFPSLSFAQGTPGGVYRAPGEVETWSYTPEHKERFDVHVIAPWVQKDENGVERKSQKTIGVYSIMDSQWPGMRKNVEKFCKQKKLKVSKIEAGMQVRIYLVPIPPPADPVYDKGLSSAKK